MKLSDIRGEKALDVLAEIMEPAVEIMADKVISGMMKDQAMPVVKVVSVAIKNHKDAVMEIMAALDGVSVSDKEAFEAYVDGFSVLTLPAKVLELANDQDLRSLFTSQGQTKDGKSSGSASENTEDQTE